MHLIDTLTREPIKCAHRRPRGIYNWKGKVLWIRRLGLRCDKLRCVQKIDIFPFHLQGRGFILFLIAIYFRFRGWILLVNTITKPEIVLLIRKYLTMTVFRYTKRHCIYWWYQIHFLFYFLGRRKKKSVRLQLSSDLWCFYFEQDKQSWYSFCFHPLTDCSKSIFASPEKWRPSLVLFESWKVLNSKWFDLAGPAMHIV